MDVKQAIAAAKNYVRQVYDEAERVSDLSLEEVVFDEGRAEWLITVEFSRPANDSLRTRMREFLESQGAEVSVPRRRVQKVIVVSDNEGAAIAMKNREAA